MPIGSSRTLDLVKKLFGLKGNHKKIPEWRGSKVNKEMVI
jgi:hypothetical protein